MRLLYSGGGWGVVVILERGKLTTRVQYKLLQVHCNKKSTRSPVSPVPSAQLEIKGRSTAVRVFDFKKFPYLTVTVVTRTHTRI